MRPLRPIHFIVIVSLMLVCFTGWKVYHTATKWNEQADVPKTRSYIVISVAPVEDHTFNPPRTNSLAVQIDGPQTGSVTIKLRDTATNKIVLQKIYQYNGGDMKDEIPVTQLPAGKYLWYAYLNSTTQSAGTLELR